MDETIGILQSSILRGTDDYSYADRRYILLELASWCHAEADEMLKLDAFEESLGEEDER